MKTFIGPKKIFLLIISLALLAVFYFTRPASAQIVTPLLYTTLDNATAVSTPDNGTGAGSLVNTNPAEDFVTGKVGSGLQINANGEYARFVQTDGSIKNVELDRGTIQFWYKPNYNHTDGQRHTIISIGPAGQSGSILIRKNNQANDNTLDAVVRDAAGTYHGSYASSGAGGYAWTAGQWVYIKITWDSAVASNEQTVHINVDGTERAYRWPSALGPYSMPTESTSEYIYIGSSSSTGTDNANGIIDDLNIFDEVLATTPAPSASPTPNPSANPAIYGQWSAPFNMPLIGIHTMLTHTGEVMMWGGVGDGINHWIWNPATGIFTKVDVSDNLFCGGQTIMADGRVMSIGGHANYFVGLKDINLYEPVTRSWNAFAPMQYGRWYATGTPLSDGKTLVTSGTSTCSTCLVDTPEVYDPDTNTWTALNNAKFTQPMYPYMFPIPNGKVLYAGGTEEYTPTMELDVNTQIWTTSDSTLVPGGSAVMYRPGKILKTGSLRVKGTTETDSLSSSYVFDATQPNQTWRQVGNMNEPRSWHTLVALPDGNVLVANGAKRTNANSPNVALSAEVWDANSENWTQMASAQIKRTYHSTALLLPDGRILVTGSGAAGGMVDQFNAEVFSPPYLFKGPRPTISSAPQYLTYGSAFQIQTPQAANIASVALVKPGAVTHTFNNTQAYVPLSFSKGTNVLDVQMSSNPSEATPGYYMLFIVDSNGVPSVASFVNIPAGGVLPSPSPSPSPTPSLTPSPSPLPSPSPSPSASVTPSPTPSPFSGLLLYSTLDDASSVSSPVSGSGVNSLINTVPVNDFVSGNTGNGLQINANGEYARFAQTDGSVKNVELDKGTIEFWYKPSYNHNDNQKHVILQVGSTTNGYIQISKNNGGGNQNSLQVVIRDSANVYHGAYVSGNGGYSWSAGQWVHIKFSWDSTLPSGTQNLKLYIDGAERPYIFGTSTTPFAMPVESPGQYIYIGTASPSWTTNASGTIDELKIYDQVI